ncbi:type IV secretion system DNA-binding domain-containing protein [Citrobacter sp. Cpo150]|uniref:type IV secretion system DNA-binding domain-containing protein n=1 Tax=Citrobacter sp. Cpo150 TaxID=2985154 RepID=UPI0025791458|nr:type IV secretion system DNA-binding domain-containing protein [Citrobacter sp. Cpo150]MDM2765765.1 type IV secretion system DNA-binding domain-containing protein [Citrobacter sp. Cpo150]
MAEHKKDASHVSELNRGGQVLMHFLRMLHQTMIRYIKAVMFVFTAMSVFFTYLMTDATDWYMGLKYGYSYIFVDYIGMKNGNTSLKLPDGRVVQITDSQIVNSAIMQQHADTLLSNLMTGLIISSILALLFAVVLYRYVRRRGREESTDEHRRGVELVSPEELITRAKDKIRASGMQSRISIAGVPLLPQQENSGIALIGSPNTGKSTTIRDLLSQLRKQKRKCVIYDISGEFTKVFYRPEVDVILNSFDKRSAQWDFWSEGKNPVIYDKMAKASIPEPPGGSGDPFWTIAPQLLFSALLEELGNRYDRPTVEHLMNIILKMPDDKIVAVVAGTDARNIMNLELEKLAGSVRAIVSAYTRNFKYLSLMQGKRFSFKEWAKDEDSDAWVFITVRDDMKTTLKSTLTLMIESALSSILTLEPDDERLIGVSMDEFGTLHQIPSFDDFIATGRKFGALPIIGFQSDSQVDVVYGEKKANALIDSMGVLAAFRVNGKSGAAWLADQIGDREVEESLENTSFGANDVRDSTSFNRSSDESNLVLKSEVQALDNGECFLCLKRGLPVAKIRSPYVKMPAIHPGILENDFFKNQENEKAFKIDNSVTPQSIMDSINRSIKASEQSKFVAKDELNPAAAKSMSDVIDDIRKEKASGSDHTPGTGKTADNISSQTNSSTSDTATDDDGVFMESFAPMDLSALVMEREANEVEEKQEEPKKENQEPLKSALDPFSNYTFK